MSVGASGFRKRYKNLLFHCNKIRPPLNATSAKKVVQLLKNRDIAAYISEPIICNLAVEIPTKEYYTIVRRACAKYGTMFIMDEVATGFGRTGKLFATEHYRLRPDILCLAKALTGGYSALGAVVMTNIVAKAMEWGFSFYSTFGGHPLNVAVALANMKHIVKNKQRLPANTVTMSRYFAKRLTAMKFRFPADIRICGLAIGLRFGNEAYAASLKKKCREQGLLVSDATEDSIILFPALTIDKKTAKEGLDILENILL